MEAAQKKKDEVGKSSFSDYDYSNFYYGAGDDPLNLLVPFGEWYAEARPAGYYLYQEPVQSAPTTRVRVKNRKTGVVLDLINLASYNYLGISYRDEVKKAAIEAVARRLAPPGRPSCRHLRPSTRICARGGRVQGQDGPTSCPTVQRNVGFISSIMLSGAHLLRRTARFLVDGAILASPDGVFRHNNPGPGAQAQRVRGRSCGVGRLLHGRRHVRAAEIGSGQAARRAHLIDEAHPPSCSAQTAAGWPTLRPRPEVDFHQGRSPRAWAAGGSWRLAGADRLRERLAARASSPATWRRRWRPASWPGGIVDDEPQLRPGSRSTWPPARRFGRRASTSGSRTRRSCR